MFWCDKEVSFCKFIRKYFFAANIKIQLVKNTCVHVIKPHIKHEWESENTIILPQIQSSFLTTFFTPAHLFPTVLFLDFLNGNRYR